MSVKYHDANVGVTLGGGGGGGGQTLIGVYQVGYFGSAGGTTATSLTVDINGYSGMYALISVMHRDTLTAPADCTLLDFTSYDGGQSLTQYVSVFKCPIDSSAKSLTFTQASSARISATVWALDNDFSLSKTGTYTFQYYMSALTISTNSLSFITFSAPYAQTTTSRRVWGVSDGAWLLQPMQTEYQLRHFSGIIPPSTTLKNSTLQQAASASFTVTSEAEVVVYTVSAA